LIFEMALIQSGHSAQMTLALNRDPLANLMGQTGSRQAGRKEIAPQPLEIARNTDENGEPRRPSVKRAAEALNRGESAMQQGLTAILPCNDLDAAEAFFARLGFHREEGSLDEYRMLSDGLGGSIHLNRAAGRNPFGLYLYREDVDSAARAFAGETIGEPRDTPWGMYGFALNGPDETLVRVGWPTRLRGKT
jgi:hypothetical protein